MPTGGIKIVSETNLGLTAVAEELSSSAGLVLTKTTNTFTPTTLKNIEQMFLEAEPTDAPEAYKSAAGFVPPVVISTTCSGGRTYVNLDSKSWQGGVTTVVTPSSVCPVFAAEEEEEEDLATMQAVRANNNNKERKPAGRRGGRRPQREEELSPEEAERRRVRRERNKLAAARCRKRRVDQTTGLQGEVDEWENKKRLLQEEIASLQAQKEELNFILEAHKSVCTRRSQQQQQHFKQPYLADMVSEAKVVVVKSEPEFLGPQTVVLEPLEVVKGADSTTATTSIMGRPRRPATLSLPNRSNMMRSIEGIAIETPTNVVSSLNFDALMDGRTGLTPTNVLTPVSISMSAASINTPSMQVPSCSSQQRGSGGLEIGSPNDVSPKLVSL